MSVFVFRLQDINKTMPEVAGGKGANLGELTTIKGINVPDGFCIGTAAFKSMMEETPAINELLNKLSLLKVGEQDKINELSSTLRRRIETATIPKNIQEEVTNMLARLGADDAYAVRSSATAEDLPEASFAGQQDTYLNIIGKEAILRHISKCWASLFTGRAVIYRLQHGVDHHTVRLAVVVQKMVFPQAAGILFTADPVSANRKVVSIDAGFGLGEALVAGLVNADNYKVRNGRISDKKIATKKRAVYALENGGTKEVELEQDRQMKQVLTDEQILQLAHTVRKIEEHFGYPQDMEWCLADDTFYIVQSRPITTLFPIPEANDQENHVYISVGHQQMMTDPIRPLGLSFFLLTTNARMRTAGGRLFVDVTHQLASPANRAMLLNVMGQHDPLIKDALITITERDDFIQLKPDDKQENIPGKSNDTRSFADYKTLNAYDPTVVSELIKNSRLSIAALQDNIQTKGGPDLFTFIREDIQLLKRQLANPQSFGVLMTAMNAALWLNEKMKEWLGEKNVADTLSLSVSNNITAEMGLELLDVADVLRPYPEVITYLQQVKADSPLEELAQYKGGEEAQAAIRNYLNKYGMRCAGEIDITNTRWGEQWTTLVPLILSNIKNFEPGAGKRKFEQGLQEALKKEQALIQQLKGLPDGGQKAEETKRMISLVRHLTGYREYPKYAMMSRYFIYKQALLTEAERLVKARLIAGKEDVYYLSFEEFSEAVSTNKLDYGIVCKRKNEYKLYQKLTPPRVITSDGEIVRGKYQRAQLPASAIVGLPVSSGIVEGRARVILNMHNAGLEAGDILVTTFTDPSWTPLFVLIKGLVTEVGGLMTHGAVIAREYGLPAVVGVENATKLIKNGQRIRVHGTEGYVEIL